MGDVTVATMFLNLAGQYPDLFDFVFTAFRFAGMVALIWGINHLRTVTDDHHRGNASPATASLVSIVIGAIVISLPEMLEAVNHTTFAESASPMGLMDYERPSETKNVLSSVHRFLQLVGVYYFGKGWLELRSVAINGETQQISYKGAAVRIFAGTALVNLIGSLKAISSTVGIPVLNTWLQQFGA